MVRRAAAPRDPSTRVRSSEPAHSGQKLSKDGTSGVRDVVLMAAGVAAAAACCLVGTLLLALGGGVVASIVFGPWGIVSALVGFTAWGVWRYRRRRACEAQSEPTVEGIHRG